MLLWCWMGCAVVVDEPVDDTDVSDTDPTDSDDGGTDLPDTDDIGGDDTDAPADDTADTDEVRDTGPMPFLPDPTCAYLDLDVYTVWCGGVQTLMRRWAPEDGDPLCLPYFTVHGDAWLDPEDALAEGGCDDTCVYRLHQAVMLVYCDTRGEYMVWVGGGPGQDPATASCPDLYEVHTVAGSAWVYDFADYEATHPCP